MHFLIIPVRVGQTCESVSANEEGFFFWSKVLSAVHCMTPSWWLCGEDQGCIYSLILPSTVCLTARELLGLQKLAKVLQVLTKVVCERTWVAWIGSVCSLSLKSSVEPFRGWGHSVLHSFCKGIVQLCKYYWQKPKYLNILFLGIDWGVIMRDGAQLEYCCWMTSPSSLFWSFVFPPSPE